MRKRCCLNVVRDSVALIALLSSVTLTAQQKPAEDAVDTEILNRLTSLERRIAELTSLVRSLLPPSPVTRISDLRMALGDVPIRGSENAKVALVEFSDFECPFCGRHAATSYRDIQQHFVNNGKVRYVFRHLPLDQIHPNARKAAEAAECAREQGQFWEFHDQLFANQKALTDSDLNSVARSIKLTQSTFDSCMAQGRASSKITADLAEAKRLGLTGTPAFLLGHIQDDGTIVLTHKIVGSQPFKVFETTLNELLNSATPQ
jgi:protein-disulfide isomerase